MHFVDAHGRMPRPSSLPGFHMVTVCPDEAIRPCDNRGSRRAHLACESERVGLQGQELAAGADDFVLVVGTFVHVRGENLPQAAIDALAHLVAPAVPVIEVAYHGDTLRLGRPNGEKDAFSSFMGDEMRAE